MLFKNELKSLVLQSKPSNFEELSLEIFRFQSEQNPVYKEFISHLRINTKAVKTLEAIPFLPISFFKSHQIITAKAKTIFTFESSGTTGTTTSRHHIADLEYYKTLSVQIFEQQYGSLSSFHILALLPSYLERSNSSLVFMVQHFMTLSNSDFNGFYLENRTELIENLKTLLGNDDGKKILLMGVTFALLDIIEDHNNQFADLDTSRLVVMETGGMKGRRREMIREEVHEILAAGFNVPKIHSEYGMTELLSQGYSTGDGLFDLPPSLKILFREVSDPFEVRQQSWRSASGMNVIDLANIDSCCFIETQDLGKSTDNQIHIVGRFDNSDVRGCNLMIY